MTRIYFLIKLWCSARKYSCPPVILDFHLSVILYIIIILILDSSEFSDTISVQGHNVGFTIS